MILMPDREKVIRLIEEEISICESVNQSYRTIDLPVLRDILALLKPRILTLDEALGSDDPVYFESNGKMECWVDAYISDDLQCAVLYRFCSTEFMLPLSRYKKDWRCWSAPPSYEQSKAVKWDA